MRLTPQVTFRNMETAPALETVVQKEAAGLDRFFNRITSCQVVIEGPGRQEPGGLYTIRIDLSAPGGNLIVDHAPRLNDARQAIHEAFEEMRRQLQDYARRIRGETKQHDGLARGKVTRLSPADDFGFLEADGHGVYFHRNSVVGGYFDRLRIGSEVRYTEEVGDKGPQASSVRLIRATRQGRRAAASDLLGGVPA